MTSEDKSMPHQVSDALQARDIEDLKAWMTRIETQIEVGFKGIHSRQDTANGKIISNEKDIAEVRARERYNKFIWYILTVAIGLIVFLMTR